MRLLAADDDPRARALAARLLRTLGEADALNQLAELLDDPDPQARAGAAGTTLRAIGAPGLLLLRRVMGSADDFTADIATQIIDLRKSHRATRCSSRRTTRRPASSAASVPHDAKEDALQRVGEDMEVISARCGDEATRPGGGVRARPDRYRANQPATA